MKKQSEVIDKDMLDEFISNISKEIDNQESQYLSKPLRSIAKSLLILFIHIPFIVVLLMSLTSIIMTSVAVYYIYIIIKLIYVSVCKMCRHIKSYLHKSS